MQPVLILGGYGNFGKRIASALVGSGMQVIVAGRDSAKAQALATSLGALAQAARIDAHRSDFGAQLAALKPSVVVNTCGPFQNADYRVAKACIANGVHYVDLADGRDFVTGITTLDAAAKARGVSVVTGASTVPALSSAVIEAYRAEFASIDTLTFGISPGQKAERGLATTRGILSYVGKLLKPFAGHAQAYGWQNIYRQEYPVLGKRWMANCDIPDLDLLPARYGIGAICFSAGLELGVLHLGLWTLSWLVRWGVPLSLPRFTKPLWRAASWFDCFGSADGGMHIIMQGTAPDGTAHTRSWFIIARGGDGPQIPCVPAIALARKFAQRNNALPAGAQACVGLIALQEYVQALESFAVQTISL